MCTVNSLKIDIKTDTSIEVEIFGWLVPAQYLLHCFSVTDFSLHKTCHVLKNSNHTYTWRGITDINHCASYPNRSCPIFLLACFQIFFCFQQNRLFVTLSQPIDCFPWNIDNIVVTNFHQRLCYRRQLCTSFHIVNNFASVCDFTCPLLYLMDKNVVLFLN